MNGTEIVRRVNILKMMRSNVEQVWNDIERYISPLRTGNMYQRPTSEQTVEWSRDDIYDSTAIWASQKFAANIHGTLTNPAYRWFEWLFKKKALNQNPQAREWVQQCTDIGYESLYDSNFDPEISSAFKDLVVLGNTIVVQETENEDPDNWEGFNFLAIPVKEMFFERDHRGNLYRVYRWLEWTAVEIKSKWPHPDKPLPAEIEKEFQEGGDPNRRFTVIYCIYARPEKKANTGSLAFLSPRERPFGCKYVIYISGDEIDKEGGYYEMPAHHCPWEKTSGSMWGHGPGMVMIPTVKYINSWLEMQDMAVRKMVDPPSLVRERGLLSDLDLKPGGETVVKDPERDVKPYLSNGRIDFSQMTLKELRDMVREAFHENELQLKESPQMSATEAQIRYELMNRVLGPTMGRIQCNLLDPLLMRHFMTLLRNKQFPPIPDIVKQEKGQFKVHYSGPLVRAQRMDEVASMERFLGTIGAAAKVFPPIMNVVDPVKYAREVADRLGVPATILRDDSTVQRMQKQQEAAQAQMTQAKLAQEHGKGAQEMAAGQAATNDNGGQQ